MDNAEVVESRLSARRRAAKELTLYFVITFAITFGLGAAFIFFRPQLETLTGRIESPLHSWLYYLAVCAPTISAILLSAAFGGLAGVKRLFAQLLRPVPLRWIALALLTIPAVGCVTGLAERLFGGGGSFGIDIRAILVTAPMLWFTTPEILQDPGPWGEETGWRGLALPRLLTLWSPLASAVLLGGIWAAWHTPAFFAAGTSQNGQDFVLFGLGAVCVSVFMTWLYVNGNRNYLVAGVVPHAVTNHLYTSHAFKALQAESLVLVLIAVGLAAGFGPSLKGWRSAGLRTAQA